MLSATHSARICAPVQRSVATAHNRSVTEILTINMATQNLLVSAEVALALILMIGVGLLVNARSDRVRFRSPERPHNSSPNAGQCGQVPLSRSSRHLGTLARSRKSLRTSAVGMSPRNRRNDFASGVCLVPLFCLQFDEKTDLQHWVFLLDHRLGAGQ